MNVGFHSTRDDRVSVSSKEAILAGIAPDGGLFVSDSLGEKRLDLTRISAQDFHATLMTYSLPSLATIPPKNLIAAFKVRMEHSGTLLQLHRLLPWTITGSWNCFMAQPLHSKTLLYRCFPA